MEFLKNQMECCCVKIAGKIDYLIFKSLSATGTYKISLYSKDFPSLSATKTSFSNFFPAAPPLNTAN